MESNLSDLEKLDELRQKGILTESEFQTKKTQILNKIGENKIEEAKQNKKLKDEKNAKGCLKFFLIVILVSFSLVFIILVFGGDNKNLKKDSIVETSQSSTAINEIAKLEKELENNKLTKVQREEIEIEIKSIRTLEFADKNISAWDRSNPKLVSATKKRMENPDSFEHIETTFDYKKDMVEATMTFRGNNAFGGKVLNVVKGIFDYDGNLIEIADAR